jgi:hypothetical protein
MPNPPQKNYLPVQLLVFSELHVCMPLLPFLGPCRGNLPNKVDLWISGSHFYMYKTQCFWGGREKGQKTMKSVYASFGGKSK